VNEKPSRFALNLRNMAESLDSILWSRGFQFFLS